MKLLIVAVAALLVLCGCGPGVTDVTYHILDGYAFSDAGGDQKTIVYQGAAGGEQIVVDARVDMYMVEGNSIVIARRPLVIEKIGNTLTDHLSSQCEYVVIDTVAHSVTRIENGAQWQKMKCDPPVTY